MSLTISCSLKKYLQFSYDTLQVNVCLSYRSTATAFMDVVILVISILTIKRNIQTYQNYRVASVLLTLIQKHFNFITTLYKGTSWPPPPPGRGQKNSVKPSQDIYKAFLKSTNNSDQHFQRSLDSDKNILLLYIIGLAAVPLATFVGLYSMDRESRNVA